MAIGRGSVTLGCLSMPYCRSVGSTPRKGQDYGKIAGCNKAWNDRTANKKEPDMDK